MFFNFLKGKITICQEGGPFYKEILFRYLKDES